MFDDANINAIFRIAKQKCVFFTLSTKKTHKINLRCNFDTIYPNESYKLFIFAIPKQV
jgi:hypothetical protein